MNVARKKEAAAALPELHEGHAPVSLHQAFEDAVYAVDEWKSGPEPVVFHEGASYPVTAITAHMRACTDTIPRRLIEEIDDHLTRPRTPSGSLDDVLYDRAARILDIVIERKRKGRYVPEFTHGSA